MAANAIRYEVTDNVAWVVLDRPDAMNAFDADVAAELGDVLGQVAVDDRVRVLVITGEGRAFCAGGDVAAFHAHRERAADYLAEIIGHLHGVITAIHQLPVPVIAGVNGIAAGAGMGLVLNADLAIATESAVFVMGYTAIGGSPDGGSSYFLPRCIGTRRAMELTLTNRALSAAEALDWGLVNQVTPDANFAATLAAQATKLASGPTRAYAAARRLIRESFDATLGGQLNAERDAFVDIAGGPDFREGVTAFVEKRKPAFKGS